MQVSIRDLPPQSNFEHSVLCCIHLKPSMHQSIICLIPQVELIRFPPSPFPMSFSMHLGGPWTKRNVHPAAPPGRLDASDLTCSDNRRLNVFRASYSDPASHVLKPSFSNVSSFKNEGATVKQLFGKCIEARYREKWFPQRMVTPAVSTAILATEHSLESTCRTLWDPHHSAKLTSHQCTTTLFRIWSPETPTHTHV